MKMMKQVKKLKNRPVLTSFFGWLLFPGMYLLVGIFTGLGVSVENSFIIASPAGFLGFCCWIAAFIISSRKLIKGKNVTVSIAGLISSLIPLAFLAFAFWVAVNGGV